MNKNRAFTLIELLVVIAIIAILAAILFPVFAQAKVAAKKTSDLSNIKQFGTSVYIYAADADDYIAVTNWQHDYVFAARNMPYMKNRQMLKSPAYNVPEGTVQRQKVGGAGGTAPGYMVDTNDACVGLGISTVGGSRYYNDIYPPMDYRLNENIFGYQQIASGCYYAPAPNTTNFGGAGANAGSLNGGVEGIGPGSTNFTSIAKVVLMTNFALSRQTWPGNQAATAGFWGGAGFKGTFGNGSNVGYMDSHAGFVPTVRLLPNLREDGTFIDAGYNWAEGKTPPANAWSNNPALDGKSFNWWGTNWAAANFQ